MERDVTVPPMPFAPPGKRDHPIRTMPAWCKVCHPTFVFRAADFQPRAASTGFRGYKWNPAVPA